MDSKDRYHHSFYQEPYYNYWSHASTFSSLQLHRLLAAAPLKLENIDECRVNPDNYVGADPPKTPKSRVWSDKKSDIEDSSTASSWNPPWLNKDAVGTRQPSPLPPKDSNGAVQNGTNTEEKDKAGMYNSIILPSFPIGYGLVVVVQKQLGEVSLQWLLVFNKRA